MLLPEGVSIDTRSGSTLPRESTRLTPLDLLMLTFSEVSVVIVAAAQANARIRNSSEKSAFAVHVSGLTNRLSWMTTCRRNPTVRKFEDGCLDLAGSMWHHEKLNRQEADSSHMPEQFESEGRVRIPPGRRRSASSVPSPQSPQPVELSEKSLH